MIADLLRAILPCPGRPGPRRQAALHDYYKLRGEEADISRNKLRVRKNSTSFL